MPHRPPAPVVVVAPDSFKGSLSAAAVADAIAAGWLRGTDFKVAINGN